MRYPSNIARAIGCIGRVLDRDVSIGYSRTLINNAAGHLRAAELDELADQATALVNEYRAWDDELPPLLDRIEAAGRECAI